MTAESESRCYEVVVCVVVIAVSHTRTTTYYRARAETSKCKCLCSGHRVWKMTNLTADWNHFHRKFDHDTSFCGF